MKIVVFSIAFLLMSTIKVQGQCCSAGNPVGGTTNIGILDSGAVRIITFYQYSHSEGYWEGISKSNFSFVKEADFNYAGMVLAYGLTNELTLEAESGYFINKTQTYDIIPTYTNKGFGLSNAIISLKYNIISEAKRKTEWTVGLGAKIPFKTEYQVVDNVELPRDVQPSTNAYGIVAQSFLYKNIPEYSAKWFMINRFESNTSDIKNFRYGNTFITSFFITKQIGHSNWTAILQIRHEYRPKDVKKVVDEKFLGFVTSGTVVDFSGGNLVFAAPQINYTIAQKWNISLLADIPVFRYYNGIQLGNKYSFALYLSRDFGE